MFWSSVFKYSGNWYGNSSLVNKYVYLSGGGMPAAPAMLHVYGAATNPLTFRISLQGQDSRPCGYAGISGQQFFPSPRREIVRGRWYRFDVYMRLNTYNPSAETCDGVLKVWLDGELVIDRSDVHYLNSIVDGAGSGAGPRISSSEWFWRGLNFAPVYGGGQNPIPARQSIRTAYMAAWVR